MTVSLNFYKIPADNSTKLKYNCRKIIVYSVINKDTSINKNRTYKRFVMGFISSNRNFLDASFTQWEI